MILYDQVTAKLLELAEREPDKVYIPDGPDEVTCHYMHGDEPGCIFGHAFYELGVSPILLKSFDKLEILNSVESLASELIFRGVLAKTPESVLESWSAVQYRQDNESSWGAAVAYGIGSPEDFSACGRGSCCLSYGHEGECTQ